MTTVAVLFGRRDSIYKTLPGTDVWDEDRDALKWPGGSPVVAHPPCGPWGRLFKFCKKPEQKALAIWAVQRVREWGGGAGASVNVTPVFLDRLSALRAAAGEVRPRFLRRIHRHDSSMVVRTPG